MSPKKVIFICLGNICRSPTAEAILAKLVTAQNLGHLISCESAGTAGYHIGEEPDPRTRAHGQKRGYSFTTLAQQFDPKKDFERFDLILCLDKTNLENIRKLDPKKLYSPKIKLLMEFSSRYSSPEVPDPYYSGPDVFEQVLDFCEDACFGLLSTLVPQKV